MTQLGTVTAPTVEVEPESVTVSWTQVANADTYNLTFYPDLPDTSVNYDLADANIGTNPLVYTRTPGTGSTSQKIPVQSSGSASGLRSGVNYKVTAIAHDSTATYTDSTESAKSTAFKTVGAKQAAAGTQSEVAHRTTNEFTGAAYASAGQTKGQVTYVRNADGTISQTTVDATTSEGATAAARDTADLPSGDMQVLAAKDEGDLQAGEGGGKTLLSDLVVDPTSLTANASVVVNPVTHQMTPITGTERTIPPDFVAAVVREDRILHEIDHTKSYVDKTGGTH
jgi:hypothetical protein